MPSCTDIKDELIKCIIESECYQRYNFKFKECLRPENNDKISKECSGISFSFTECKKGLVNLFNLII